MHKGVVEEAAVAIMSMVVVPGLSSVIVVLAWANVSKKVNRDFGKKLGDEEATNAFSDVLFRESKESPASEFLVTVMLVGIAREKLSRGVSTLFHIRLVKSVGTNNCGLVVIVHALWTVTTNGLSVWHVVLVFVMDTVALTFVVPGCNPLRVIW